ncbi:MAG: ComF family protein, partial [Bifidobacterium sp.]|nr:ComF family protein [Bifidobacterium sp.]
MLFPRGCAGCGMPDETLCPSCAAALGDPRPFPLAGTVAGGVACGSYTGPVRRAVLAWKDHGDCGCDAPFAAALCTLLAQEELAAAPLRS